MAIWIVDPLNGNDANTGTSTASAKKTYAAAQTAADNGDTIQIRGYPVWVAGTSYTTGQRVVDLSNGVVYRATSNTSSATAPSGGGSWARENGAMLQEWVRIVKGLIVESYPGEKAVVNGANFTLPPRGSNGEGIDAGCGPGFNGGTVCWDEATYRALVDARADNVTVRNLVISESLGRGFGAQNGVGNRVSNITCAYVDFRRLRHNAIVIDEVDGYVLEHNTIRQTGIHCAEHRPVTTRNWPQGISVKYNTDGIIRFNDLTEHWGEGVGITNNSFGVQLYGNKIYNNYNSQVYFHRCQDVDAWGNLLFEKQGGSLASGVHNPLFVLNNEDKRRADEVEIDGVRIFNNICIGGDHSLRNQGGRDGNTYYPFANVTVENNTFALANQEAIFIAGQAQLSNYLFRGNTTVKGSGEASQITNYNGGKDITWGPNNYSETPPSALNNTGNVIGVALANPTIPTSLADFDVADYYHASSSAGRNTSPNPTLSIKDFTGETRQLPTDFGALDVDATTVVPPTGCANNLAQNGEFSSGTANWTGATDGVFEVVSGEAHMSGTNAMSPFNSVYQTGFGLVGGATYRVSFRARHAPGSSGTILRLNMLQASTPNTNLGLGTSFTTTDVMATYEATFVATASEANAMFRFRFASGDFYVDDLCIESDAVATPPEASFGFNVTGNTLSLSDTSTGGVTAWLWDLGDGNTSTDQNPTHQYATPGTYTVTLTVTGPGGSDTFSDEIDVGSSAPVPVSTAERFVMNGAGTVTQQTSHPQIALVLMPPDAGNLLGEYSLSFNVFTGIGQVKESCGQCRTLYFNIDTGEYRTLDSNGTEIGSGTENRLATYGVKHPIHAGYSGSRGQGYWDWAQSRYASLNGGYVAQAWPNSLQAQMELGI